MLPSVMFRMKSPSFRVLGGGVAQLGNMEPKTETQLNKRQVRFFLKMFSNNGTFSHLNGDQ